MKPEKVVCVCFCSLFWSFLARAGIHGYQSSDIPTAKLEK